jgi:LysM repeat protein
MIIKIAQRLLMVMVLLSAAGMHAQTKSTNIQTVDGKKYYLHKIEKSQSLYAISKLYNVSLDDLYKYNPELKAGAKANQEIKIPYGPVAAITPLPPPAVPSASVLAIDTNKYQTYKISKGETLYSLTRKFNLSEKELLNYNPSLSTGLREGQVIITGEKNRKKFSIPVSPSKPAPVAAPREKPVNMVVDTMLNRFVSKPTKTDYRIALMLPFKLEQTLGVDNNELVRSNSNFPNMPALSVDFYLGFKKAVDSLNSSGFEINLNLYDVDEKDSAKSAEISLDPDFKQLDMIFGPLHASTFKIVSKRAKDAGIPIISPITQENKILHNNMYISKTSPSKYTLMESLADYLIDSLIKNNANIILMTLNEKDRKELAFVSAFKKYYNERQRSLGKTLRDTVTLARGMYGVKQHYRAGAANFIVCLSSNQVFFTDFATQLALFADNKDITLCGWQAITEVDNIDQAYLEALHYTFPYQYNINHLSAYKVLIEDYKRLQETTPGEYFYIGFDIAYYYLSQLRDKGPDFVHTLDQLPMETNYMRFRFTHPDRQTGFDNRGVYIFKYKNYQISSTGWK